MANLHLPHNYIDIIEEEVSKILEICFIEYPPVDAFLVAEKLNYEIGIDEELKTRGYKRRRWGKDEIIVNSPNKSERKHFTIAHEIAEHRLAGHATGGFAGADKLTGEDLEKACNAMASSLLMPAQWFEMDAKTHNFDLLELKKIYSTASHEAIAYRMLLFSECIISIFDNGKATVRKSSINNLHLGEHIHPIEVKCFQKVSDSGEPFTVSGDNVRVQGWPVFKLAKRIGGSASYFGGNDWKRVILRTEMDTA
ncbi:MAG TPA: ImmA/IrrE family metallo-endopeptidase [Candidatus Brocadiia bacterium]|nr:ImmA/IrrE family metallo-endopeptidase [Candidatus Brocadiales bacterium]